MTIKSPNVIVNNLKDYNDYFKSCQDELLTAGVHWLFRGHSADNYTINSTLSRYKLSLPDTLKFEETLLKNFKELIINGNFGNVNISLPSNPKNYLENWYLEYQMRHLEIPSRLIDWSFNRNIALYFAISDVRYRDSNGHVWFYPSQRAIQTAQTGNPKLKQFLQEYIHLTASERDQQILSNYNPFNPSKTLLVHNILRPDGNIAELRRMRQSGKFIANPNEKLFLPLEDNGLGLLMRKVLVPAKAKALIQKELAEINVQASTVIPEIDEFTKQKIDLVISKSLQEIGK